MAPDIDHDRIQLSRNSYSSGVPHKKNGNAKNRDQVVVAEDEGRRQRRGPRLLSKLDLCYTKSSYGWCQLGVVVSMRYLA